MGSKFAFALMIVATPTAGLAIPGTAQAEPTVSQCLTQFVDVCSGAISDPTSFLEAFGKRDGAFVYTTPDATTRVASITSSTDLGNGAGIWERLGFTEIGAAAYVTCAFDCSFEDERDADTMQSDLFAALDALTPRPEVVGGPLEGNASEDLGLDWWGDTVFYATKWSSKPDLLATITLHCCGLAIDASAQIEMKQ